jgi:hypothetical protein
MKQQNTIEKKTTTLRSTMSTSKPSTNDDNADDLNPVEEIVAQAKQDLSMIEQLLEDMEDEDFWSLPSGEWEAKNGRDKDGLPIE